MGPENSSEVESLVLYTADGQRIGAIRDLRDLPEVTVAAGKERGSAMRRVMASLSMTISVKSVKPEKSWRCRSRKRFIKLLVSRLQSATVHPFLEHFPALLSSNVLQYLQTGQAAGLRYASLSA